MNIGAAETIGNRIKEWREKREMTQEQLAEKIGTDKSMIGRLEKGERELKPKWVRSIAEALAVRPEELVSAEPAPSFASRLREYRAANQLTQGDVAEVLGVTQPTIHRWEDGQRKAFDLDPRAIAAKLNVSPAWLMGLDAEPQPAPGRVHIAIHQEVTVDQAARIFAILNEPK